MIISKDELGEIFDKIHNVWIQTRTTVVILTAADCDAICTTKILTSLLATEMISYTIQPVLSYEDIARHNDTTLLPQIQNDELHSVIMINCGAIVDLTNLLFIRPFIDQFQTDNPKSNKAENEDSDIDDIENDEETNEKMEEYIDTNMEQINPNFNVFVVDAHRPFNLINVYDDHRIHLLQGIDEKKIEDFPQLIDFSETENLPLPKDNVSDTENDIDFANEDAFDIDFEEPKAKRRKLNNDSTLSDKERESIKLRRVQDEYYKYQYYALSSSLILFLMSRSIQKDDTEMLWMGILGLTESFIFEKIDRDAYNECVAIYCDEINRRFSNQNNSSSNSHYEYNYSGDHIEQSRIVSHREMDSIQFSREFRFILMRFWTLYDSMYYSRYIATQFGVWKQRGKDELKYLLAKMALPLSEAKQPFSAMKREYKRRLPQLFADMTQTHIGLDSNNLTFGSFTKQHGSHQSISASDMVYAITAVLESDFRVNQSNQSINDDSESLLFDSQAWTDNFFYGYDALNKNKQAMLRIAIDLAKARQCEIVAMGIGLIEKRCIKTLGIMRYCCIDNHSDKFQSPLLLCKLGLFIMDAFRAQTNKNCKHFILASYNDRLNSYIVVGIPAKKYVGDVNKSPFYTSFEEARKRVKAHAKIVFFEGHVIQIHKDHFNEWLENLHERLLAYAF